MEKTMVLWKKLWNFDLLWKKLWYYGKKYGTIVYYIIFLSGRALYLNKVEFLITGSDWL